MKNLFVIFPLIAALVGSQHLYGQFKNIKIDEGPAMIGPEEPSICISPKNQKWIMAGSNIHNFYVSKNGGKKWTKGILTSTIGVYGDPCLVSNAKGDFFFFHLSDSERKGREGIGWLDRIVCQRTSDFGETWTNGASIGLNGKRDQDKEWAVIDQASGHIYVTWTQFDLYESHMPGDSSNILFSRSTDNGETFSIPQRLNDIAGDCLDEDSTAEGAVPAVGPNGEIYVAWSLNDNIYFNSSQDQGRTWQNSNSIPVTGTKGWAFEIPGILRCNGMPVTRCDLSNSPHKGTIYINWSDQRNGKDNTDIWLTKSTDAGKTWAAPKRVNNDTTRTHQFFTWMDVDPSTGNIYIVYYDRSKYDDNRTDVVLSWSTDGGETFKSRTISEKPFVPVNFIFFGDYNNISAVNGVIRPMWTRYEDQKLSVWTALIEQKKLK